MFQRRWVIAWPAVEVALGVLSKSGSANIQGRDYDKQPGITADWLATNPPHLKEAAHSLCGPRPFLRALVGRLAPTGVPVGSNSI
jgi:hypothetical protein